MTKYLDLNKLEYSDSIVEIDDLIAETVLELNKKGYITYACCSGHSDQRTYSSYAQIKKKDEVIKEGYAIYGEDASNVYYTVLKNGFNTYIKFDGPYNFETIPEGFTYETAEEAYKKLQILIETDAISESEGIVCGDSISREIKLIDSNGKMRTDEEVNKEIDEANKILLEWSKSLEPINIKKI